MTGLMPPIDSSSGGSSSTAGRRWYAVQAQPQREGLALLHLARQRFESFCPMLSSISRRSGRPASVKKAFFPGYLFVNLDLEQDRWRSINGTIGVMRLIGFSGAGRPASLPTGFIDRLKHWTVDRPPMADDGLGVGDRVRVIGGPFDDLCGVLATANDNDRVTILLSLLGKETRVTLPRGSLIAA